MAIDVECPHCKKAYRLKDELAGKRVTCNNPTCRKVFAATGRAVNRPTPPAGGAAPARTSKPTATVTPEPMPKAPKQPNEKTPSAPPGKPAKQQPTNGKIPTAQKAPPRPPADAEMLAEQVLSDGASGGGTQTVEMTCAACEHKWTEPWEKQGKNTICPECRHRQKVPVIKKEDWRTQSLPAGAKQDDIPDDVIDLKNTAYVSGESLEKAGVELEEIEPRPTWHYFAAVAAVFVVAIGTWTAVTAMRRSGQEKVQHDLMASAIEALKEIEQQPDALPKNEAPLFRAAAYMAAAEHDLRRNTPEYLAKAVGNYAVARQALADAPATEVRDALFVDLLLAQVALGGDEQQVKAGTRLDWRQQLGGTVRPRVKDTSSNVQQELQRTLLAMLGARVKLDARLHAVRGATRELCRRGHPELLTGVLANGFDANEQPEAVATMCLETLRETRDKGLTFKLAQNFGLATNKLPSQAFYSLTKALGRDDFKAVGMYVPEPKASGSPVTEQTRRTYAVAFLAENRNEDAVELAKRPPQQGARTEVHFETLSLVSESLPDASSVIEVAAEVLAKPRPQAGPNPPQMPAPALARLARAAARCGQHEQATLFANAITDPGLKEWAKAEILRIRLADSADRAPEGEAAAPIPDNPKDYKVGHALALQVLARHNAALGAGSVADIEGWRELKTFGLAGLALGQQDRISPR